jgi:hypothetical protein
MKRCNVFLYNTYDAFCLHQIALRTEEIINIIRKMYKLKVIDYTFSLAEAETAIYNSDYYIRPGIDKERFMNELGKLFVESKLQGDEMDEKHSWFHFIILALNIMKNSFDEAYFEEQIERRKQAATASIGAFEICIECSGFFYAE